MAKRSILRNSDVLPSSADALELLPSADLNPINLEIADRLERDDAFRRKYLKTWAANEVATELRQMRKRRRLRQAEVATEAQTGQSAISRIEKTDYDAWTFKTLLNIAAALRARLRIQLEPIEDVAGRFRQIESGLDADLLDSDGADGGNEAQPPIGTARDFDFNRDNLNLHPVH